MADDLEARIRAARAGSSGRGPEPPPGGLFGGPTVPGADVSDVERRIAAVRAGREERGTSGLADLAGRASRSVGRGVESTLAFAGDPAVQKEAAEIAASMVAGGAAGGLVGAVGGGARGFALRTGARALSAGLAGAGAGEFMAPEGEEPAEARSRRLVDFAEGAGGEVLGEVARPAGHFFGRAMVSLARRVPVVRRFFDPLRAAETGRIHEGAEAALEQLSGRAPPTAGQLLDVPFIDTLENMAESSFTASGSLTVARQNAERAAAADLDKFTQGLLGLGQREQGAVLQAAVEDSGTIFRAVVRQAYANVDELLAAQSRREVVDTAAGAVQMIRQPVRIGPVKDELRRQFGRRAQLDDTLRGVLDWLDNEIPNSLTFQEAADLRSILLEMGRGGKQTLFPDTLKAASRRAAGLVDEALATTGQRLEGDAYALWREANALSKFGHEQLNDRVIGQLIGAVSPEQAWRTFARNANPTLIRRVRGILFDPRIVDPTTGARAVDEPVKFWEGLQGQWLLEQQAKAEFRTLEEVGRFDAGAVRRAIKRSGETFEALFPDPAQRETLQRLLNTLEITQSRAGGGRSGSMLIQFQQARAGLELAAVFGFAGSDDPRIRLASAAVLLGPLGIARAFRNEKVSRFFMHGATGQFGGEQSARFMGQLAARLREENIPFKIRVPRQEGGSELVEVEPGRAPRVVPQRAQLGAAPFAFDPDIRGMQQIRSVTGGGAP